MTIFLLTLGLVALSTIGMCITIIIKKNGKFPVYSIGQNRSMKKQGIRCPREEERMLYKKGKNEYCSDCRKA
ncbi:MAG: hypothetical protein WC918_05300 [Bacteroidales bacterium]|jgi:hypothetical protein|nr:hypothetical protein [Bacteroidales bacterium]